MRKLARALLALLAIGALVIGVPAALTAIAGWPLPTKMPDWNAVYWAARQGNIPAEFVVKTLACVVWLAWAQIVWAMAWEVCVNMPRVVRGRAELGAPLAASSVSRLARQMVSAVMLFSAVATTPAMTVAAPPLSSLATAGGPPGGGRATATLVIDTADTSRTTSTAAATWTVAAGDTLWDIAERCLGDGSRVDEIVRCNTYLTPSRPLRVGQVIDLPAGAIAPAVRSQGTATTNATRTDGDEAATHTVSNGDTLWGIVEHHYGFADRTTVLAVAEHNAIDNPSLILPGQQVRFPILDSTSGTLPPSSAPSASAGIGTVYTVMKGDALWGIVERHYGSATSERVWAVADANQLENPSLILPADVILLPAVADLNAAPVMPVPDEARATNSPDETGDAAPAPNPTTNRTAHDTTPAETPTTPPPTTASPTAVAPPTVSTPPASVPAATTAPATATSGPANTVQRAPVHVAPVEGREQPAISATPVRAASEVETRDVLGARWLFGTIAVTSLALGGAWVTLRQLRQRRRRWLGITPPPVGTTAAPTPREHGAQTDLAVLAELVDADLASGATVRGILLGESTELRFRDAAPDPPPGWQAGQTVWRRVDHTAAAPRVVSPALVTIGHSAETGEVVLDLAAAGAVSVTGDRVAVEQLMCSMLWELAACPLGVPVDLHVVGLACAAEQHTANRARLVSLGEAVDAARAQHLAGDRVRVFLVDPFAAGDSPAGLADLVSECAAGTGRAVVVAGPCEQPSEEISVPNAQRCMWDDLVLTPPQFNEHVDAELGQLLAAVSIGRRPADTTAPAVLVPDAEAEAVALRATATLLDDDPDEDSTSPGTAENSDNSAEVRPDPVEPADTPAASVAMLEAALDAVASPEVLLTVCGRAVSVIGHPVPQATSVLFVLAAAGKAMHAQELCELTGYAPKSLSTVYTTNHPLVEREAGALRLGAHVWTDHRWANECVRQLAAAMQDAVDSPDTFRWMQAAAVALRSIEQGPYAVLPTSRERARAAASAWGWVDEFPADVPARAEAETEVAEAALAFTELWLAAPGTHTLVRPSELVAELCRLAGLIPYANVAHQIRPSPWVTGAECLLVLAAEVAGDDERALTRVQQTARAMAAREQLIASSELAEALGL